LDNSEQNSYSKQLRKYRHQQTNEELGYQTRKLMNPKHRESYEEKLIISGFHISHTAYDMPIWKGFERREDSVDQGVEKRKKSEEMKKMMEAELEDYTRWYAHATKDDREAIEHLEEIKKKYADVIGIREDNNRRKINNLKSKIQANFDEWTHFITLTQKDNTMDIEKSKKRLKKWFEKMSELFEDFLYVYVMEFQDRGSIHFHVLCRLDKGKTVGKQKFMKVRESWKHGAPDIKGIRYKKYIPKEHEKAAEQELKELETSERVKRIWSVGNYLTSYLKKGADDVLLFGSKMYGASKGLKDEIVITNPKKIAQYLEELGIEQLKEKSYDIPQKVYDEETGSMVDSESHRIRMSYYNKLIPKSDD